MTTLTLLAISIVLAIAAGILANALRNRDKELEVMAESYNALRHELTQTQTERAKAIQAKEDADKLRDRIERAAKVVEEERDRLLTERANLYFRNSKGQIQKVNP
jgi:ABC-type phosphate transport system auxiliary subunit